MNRIYRLVWSRSLSALVVASELAKAARRGNSPQGLPPARVRGVAMSSLMAALAATGAVPALAGSLDGGTATGANGAIAIGSTATASGLGSIAMGNSGSFAATTVANAVDAMALGNGATATAQATTSLGVSAHATANFATALGVGADANGEGATSAGRSSEALFTDTVAIGRDSSAGTTTGGAGAVAVGSVATASGANAIALGFGSAASGGSALAAGNAASASVTDAVAIGRGAAAANAGAVALGAGSSTAAAVATTSTTINGTTYNFAGNNPGSTVSVGAVGTVRTLTNLAAGRISTTSTDAINGSQLAATNAAVTDVDTRVDTLGSNTAANFGGGSTYNPATGGVSAPTYSVNGNNYSDVGSAINAIVNGGDGIKYFRVNSVQADSTASGADSTAIGPVAVASGTRAVAVGPNAAASGENGIAVGSAAAAGGTSAIALGTSSSAFLSSIAIGSNAVAGSAGGATGTAVGLNSAATGNFSSALGPETNASGTSATAVGVGSTAAGISSIALGHNSSAGQTGAVALGAASVIAAAVGTASATIAGTTYNFAGAAPGSTVSIGSASVVRTLTNLAAGRLSGTSTDAVNGSQLFATNTAVTDLDTRTDAQGSSTAANFGGGSAYDPATGTVSAPAYSVGGSTYDNVGDALDGTNVRIDSISNGAGIKYFHANSALGDATAIGTDSVAAGPLANAEGVSAVAVGNGAGALSSDSVAMGRDAVAGVSGGASGETAVGATASATGDQASAFGFGSNAAGDSAIAVGSASASAASAVAIGSGATAADANAVALGAGSTTAAAVGTASGVIAGTTYNFAGTTPASTVSIGAVGSERTLTNVAAGRISGTSTDAVNGSQLFATNTAVDVLDAAVDDINAGAGIKYFHANSTLADSTAGGVDSVAIGPVAVASADDAVALGNGATSDQAGAVALGAGSVTAAAVGTASGVIAGTTYTFAGTTPASTVSVGAVGSERTLTNVAAGRLSDTSTDAVNGSQLFATNTAVTDLDTRTDAQGSSTAANFGGGSAYDPATGTVGAPAYSVGGSTYNNVGDALDGTNVRIDNISNGAGIKYFHANSTLADSTAGGVDSVAIGPVAVASADDAVALGNGATSDQAGAVALGAGSVTAVAVGTASGVIAGTPYNFAGTTPGSTVSIGAVGSERTLTNVAAGRLSDTSTDAVNGSQLFATNTAVDSLDGRVDTLGTSTATSLGGGSTYDPATGTVNAPAYNVGGNTYNNVGDAITNLATGGATSKYFHANSTLADSSATGTDSVAIGPVAVASADDAVALGNGATSDQAGAVALGAGSATAAAVGTASGDIAGTTYTFAGAAPASTVSIGAAGSERTLTNVAAGRLSDTSTDAVNGSQLFATNTAVDSLDGRVDTLGTSTATSLGGGSTYDPATGTVNAPAYNVGGNTYNNVGDAITNLANGGATSKYFHANSTLADSSATGTDSVAIGPVAVASADDAVALGNGATSDQAGAVALGAGSVTAAAVGTASGVIAGTPYNFAGTTPGSTVSIGAVGSERTLTNVAAGRLSDTSTDAVNGSQLFATNTAVTDLDTRADAQGTSTAANFGGGATYDPATGTVSAPAYSVGGTTYDNVGDALDGTNVRIDNISNGAGIKYFHANSTLADSTAVGTDSVAVGPVANAAGASSVSVGNGADALSSDSVAMGRDAVAGVAGGTSGETAVGATASATGEAASAFGFGSNAAGADAIALGSASASAAQSVALGAGAAAAQAGAVALGSGSVTAAAVGTSSATIAGTPYSFAGTTPASTVSVGASGTERTLTNVAAGRLSATSTDAVNGSQLFATNQEVTAIDARVDTLGDSTATSLGGGATYDTTTGAVTGPTYNVGGTTVNNVGDAITNLDGRTTANTTAITNLGDQIDSGQVGLVRQDTATRNITVAAATDGMRVDVTGTVGTRTLTGLTDGVVSAVSTDAINGSQLHAGNVSIADIFGGGAAINPDGTLAAPTYTVTDIDYDNVGDAIGQIDVMLNALSTGVGIKYFISNSTLAPAVALGANSTAMGPRARSEGEDAIAIGNAAVAGAPAAGGAPEQTGAVAMGSMSSATATQATALGRGAQATQAGSVALGAGAVTEAAVGTAGTTIAGTSYTFAGATPASTVSVGAAGAERTITNVAAGRLSPTSTDAVNGSQLFATNQSVEQLSTALGDINTGAGIRYFHANSGGPDSVASGPDSVAVGPSAAATMSGSVAVGNGATAQHANSVALGAGSQTSVGPQPNYQAAYVGTRSSAGEVNVGSRTISGVAAGSAATDAVNVGQLQAGVDSAVNQANSYTDARITEVGGAVTNVKNLQQGSEGMFRVSQDDTATPTVTGIRASAGGAGAIASGTGSLAVGTASGASGENAVAIGTNATVSGANSVAIGAGSVASAADTVSVGSAGRERKVSNVAAGVDDTDAVNLAQLKAIEAGSLRYDSNPDGSVNPESLTLNPGGSPTTLHNVGPGVAPTDAVNLGQLQQVVGGVRQDMWELRRDARGGTASAMAMAGMPQANGAGRRMLAVGMGGYQGEVGMALGMSGVSENGRYIYKAQVSGNTTSDFGFSVGAGLQW